MKEAKYYKKLKNNTVQCELCPHSCVIKDGDIGFCNVRKNENGKLYSLVYGKSISAQIDPIEKKPLYHFLPGSRTLSIGTVGCNLKCQFCQNWQTAQAKPDDFYVKDMLPGEIIKKAQENECKIISYTYNEPTVFFEYMIETAKLAKKAGIKNTMVSNGFISAKPLQELCQYLDAANIDLKSYDDAFYKKICKAHLNPVLDTLQYLHKKVWLEITNLIIPTLNDKPKNTQSLCKWIKENLSLNVPMHFSAFYPCYQLQNIPPTSPEILLKARRTALSMGFRHAYIGNIHSEEGNNTYCPDCNKLLIERYGFSVISNNLKNGKCPLNHKISGVF
jgi:pyruvate formate lyase activating enzyme